MKISTAKQYRPNWKKIFSQLQNYFFTIKCHLFLDLLRDLKTFLLSQISQTKTKSVY